MSAQDGFAQFVEDIQPMFFRANLTYVDVGAYDGAMLDALVEGGLSVGEAHLIEPNPAAFALLEARTAPHRDDRAIHLYRAAAGDRETKLVLKDARKMTTVLGKASTASAAVRADTSTFKAKSVTLDSLRSLIRGGHVSLLKVDVEGYEERVLAGAAGLLSDQAVDVIHIEAGADREARQQVHYRRLEDVLNGHGYRLFKIYEQMHEWTEDSPVLRRMNMAFISARFADRNPLKLSRELMTSRKRLSDGEDRIAELRRELDRASGREAEYRAALLQAQSVLERSANQGAALKAARAALDDAGARVVVAESLVAFEQSRVAAEVEQRDALAGRLRDVIDRQAGEIASRQARIDDLEAQLDAAEAVARRELEARDLRIVEISRRADDVAAQARDDVGRLGAELSAARQQMARLTDDLAEARKAIGAAIQPDDGFQEKAQLYWKRHRSLATQLREQKARWDAREAELTAAVSAEQSKAATLKKQRDRALREAARDAEAREAAERTLARFRKGVFGGLEARLQSLRRGLARTTRNWRGTASPQQPPPQATIPSVALSTASAEAAGSSKKGRPSRAAKRPATRAKQVDAKLWGGFSQSALFELERISADGSAIAEERMDADRALAAWHAAEARPDDALAALARLRGHGDSSIETDLLEAHVLAFLGRSREVRSRLLARLVAAPVNPAVPLAVANTFVGATRSEDPADSEARLAFINRAYEAAGLAPLVRIDPAFPVKAGNLRTDPDRAPNIEDGPLVSVIVPAYQAEDSIDMTLDGLVQQTWRNLEIIVVDDASLDGTAARVEARAHLDPRIRLLRQNTNQGSYGCRNLGLTVAAGAFITVHDAGDWSHAQKVERQVRHLETNPDFIANHSKWARAFENLLFLGKFRRKDRLIDWNPSSLMFRRELLDLVGGWDGVRISADAEFVRRAKAAAAPMEIGPIPEAAPLAFGFDTPASLTKHSTTHGRTITHGFRREYHEAANAWHAQADRTALKLPIDHEARAFPAPGPILADRRDEVAVDLLILGPLNEAALPSDFEARLDAAMAAGVRVGLFNWRLYESDVSQPVAASLRRLSRERDVPIAAPGETVRARAALVLRRDVLDKPVDLFPATRIDEVVVIGEAGTAREQALAAALLGDRGRWLEENAAWKRATDAARGIAGVKPKSRKKPKPKA